MRSLEEELSMVYGRWSVSKTRYSWWPVALYGALRHSAFQSHDRKLRHRNQGTVLVESKNGTGTKLHKETESSSRITEVADTKEQITGNAVLARPQCRLLHPKFNGKFHFFPVILVTSEKSTTFLIPSTPTMLSGWGQKSAGHIGIAIRNLHFRSTGDR